MRKILFRGKDKSDGTWFEGFFVKQGDDAYLFTEGQVKRGIGTNGWLNCCQMYSVIPETIGQYTGLMDRNGVRIFEGDVVVYDNSPYNVYCTPLSGVIVWRNGSLCFKHIEHGFAYYRPLCTDDFFAAKCEIIGNIHDNTELMEG